MEDYKLNWIEKKTYKALYNSIAKLLKVCYEVISDDELVHYYSYEEFCNVVNEKLKGN